MRVCEGGRGCVTGSGRSKAAWTKVHGGMLDKQHACASGSTHCSKRTACIESLQGHPACPLPRQLAAPSRACPAACTHAGLPQAPPAALYKQPYLLLPVGGQPILGQEAAQRLLAGQVGHQLGWHRQRHKGRRRASRLRHRLRLLAGARAPLAGPRSRHGRASRRRPQFAAQGAATPSARARLLLLLAPAAGGAGVRARGLAAGPRQAGVDVGVDVELRDSLGADGALDKPLQSQGGADVKINKDSGAQRAGVVLATPCRAAPRALA